ncbi:hypothetical protein GCM10022240_25310 [Microbacterium kribbense]|uniref:Uncharacterized protein n=1 Tax=Microbacterium kribbense TaxID=433645 RepID=A0ABP7GP32_9MICO
MQPRSRLPGALIAVGGVVVVAWVVFGRALFGVAGQLTVVYLVTLGVLLVVLNAFISDSVMRTARRGFQHRRATFAMLFVSWGCALVLGLLIPDITTDGLQTIATGASEPGRGIAVGFANPFGVVMVVCTIWALVLARGDSNGRADRPHVEEDDGY